MLALWLLNYTPAHKENFALAAIIRCIAKTLEGMTLLMCIRAIFFEEIGHIVMIIPQFNKYGSKKQTHSS